MHPRATSRKSPRKFTGHAGDQNRTTAIDLGLTAAVSALAVAEPTVAHLGHRIAEATINPALLPPQRAYGSAQDEHNTGPGAASLGAMPNATPTMRKIALDLPRCPHLMTALTRPASRKQTALPHSRAARRKLVWCSASRTITGGSFVTEASHTQQARARGARSARL